MRQVVKLSRIRELAANGTARAIREAAGISMREMAEEVGVGVSTLWRWEHAGEEGGRVPHGPPAVRYLDALDALLARGARQR